MGVGTGTNEFIRYVKDLASGKKSHYYYSAELEALVIAADPIKQTLTVRVTLGDEEINEAGYIDEGVAGTVADYWTSTLISAVHEGRSSVTTSLGVQTIRPVPAADTAIDVVCQASGYCGSANPHAVARFVDASDHQLVYAVVTHTKFFK
ncbi:hypothetical protein H4R99_005705 [Coemansia sp. RSA 1722]|nr:hypothetical protein LPJ57_003729 [Coemansia sp. RSA 486]KAJ2237999.1 hypothetical protein IWW45_000474 [Coemansia sp. RSA 485]KAJ2594570.1 hypothetical protein H4R99_005705 [Coemansia sp. RSA 1722]